MTQAFKGVVWAHGPTHLETGETVHRYVVVGLVVSSKPIPELEVDPSREEHGGLASEAVLCGGCPGLLEALAGVEHGRSTIRLGDASMVLLTLNTIHPMGEET